MELGGKLSDRYLLKEFVGQGGMANVYLARDLILDRDVAVKVLRFDFQDNADAIRRFQREAMSASQLLHHNIVEIYDVEQEAEQQYIVMEYVKGTDLKTFIRQNAPISLQTAVAIMSQILSAINEAHKNQIIHRDIKPQNILITSTGEVKITDFGIAVALSDTSITQTNTLLGSVHYMSPEQARGGNATVKSDIYALGVVLYELITGSVPFDGESAVSVALKHFQEEFPRIKDKIDYVPQSLENVVLKATAKDLESRYNSVNSMLLDLSTALSASRMSEPKFIPNPSSTVTAKLKPIHPINTQKGTSPSLDAPEPLDEKIFSYDKVAPINQPKKRYKFLRYLLMLLIVGIISAGAWFIYSELTQSTTVPSFDQLTQEQAVEAIQKANLVLGDVTQAWDEAIPAGHIISANPSTNTKVEKGSSVDLVISNGKEQVEIGDYTGQDYEMVRAQLSEAGFIVDRKDFASSAENQGKILSQSVPMGTKSVPSKTAITFTVGKVVENVTMQDFYNLPENMVDAFAEANGLTVTKNYEYSDYISEGYILEQSPDRTTPIYQGDTITVTISQGPKEVSVSSVSREILVEYVPTYAQTDVNQTKPLPNKVQVFIGDSVNSINDLYTELDITETETIKIILKIATDGKGQYRVVRDGNTVEENNEVYPE